MALTTFVAGAVLTAQQLNDSFATVGGLRAVVPTSVSVTGGGSSGSVGTNGTVTFSTAESVSINDCFSSAFTNYLLVCDFDTSGASANINARFRVGGVDNSTANAYNAQIFNANSTTIAGLRETSTSFRIAGGANVATNGFIATIFRPFLVDTTAASSHHANSFANAFLTLVSATHNQNTSYDGLTLIPSSGSITGAITVYGFGGL